ncbi:MAG: zf-HC2 domain-containing protein [Phycisphaerales bacterium]|nr:zf-HC2 domain-containing protein [Phycisphaerales bacterium]MCI0676312.1 zf-HC2 domain-containing protein [Phycisphaerales bacterium]
MSFSCQHASRLISESMDRQISGKERLSLRFHLLICSYCRRFRRQLARLRLLIRDHVAHHDLDTGTLKLSVEARAHIYIALVNQH